MGNRGSGDHRGPRLPPDDLVSLIILVFFVAVVAGGMAGLLVSAALC